MNLWIVFNEDDMFKAVYSKEKNALDNCNSQIGEWVLATNTSDKKVEGWSDVNETFVPKCGMIVQMFTEMQGVITSIAFHPTDSQLNEIKFAINGNLDYTNTCYQYDLVYYKAGETIPSCAAA